MGNSKYLGKIVVWNARSFVVRDADDKFLYGVPVGVTLRAGEMEPRVKIPISEIVQVIVDVYEFTKLNWPFLKRVFETIKSWFKGKEKK